MRTVPDRWRQSLRAGDRSRLPTTVYEILTEIASFIGKDENVVVYALREYWHFCLRRSPRVMGIGPAFFRNDTATETIGSSPDGFGKACVRFSWTDDKKPSRPTFTNEILCEAIR